MAQPACDDGNARVPVITARVLETFPHDTGAFTQGLAVADGQLYEGTGLLGQSSLRRVDIATGAVLEQVHLPSDVFGEGIAVVRDRIIQLSWRSHIGYVYDRQSFSLLGTFGYPTEGWGLAYDGARLILSDGSDTLRFIDPDSFLDLGRVRVRAAGRPVLRLNELECIDGLVYANVWQTDRIAVIDPGSGDVCSWIDLTGINTAPVVSRNDVLNGIAYDANTGQLYVTGKRWPKLFRIEVDQPPSLAS